jgi:hypothetical protein
VTCGREEVRAVGWSRSLPPPPRAASPDFISHKVFIKSVYKMSIPKFVNLFFLITNMNDQLRICAGIDFRKKTLQILYVRQDCLQPQNFG